MLDTKVIREKILQLAIQGKLVEQRAEEGSVEELYNHIQEEKRELVEKKIIKKKKPAAQITKDEVPFDIPLNWKWVRLGDITSSINDGVHFAPQYYDSGVRCYSAKDIYNDKINDQDCYYISRQDYLEMKNKIDIKDGSLLISKSGSIGRTAIVEKIYEFGLVESVGVINLLSGISPKFVKLYFDYLFFDGIRDGLVTGVAVKHLTLSLLNNIPIPMPLLSEQERIVEKIEQIFFLLDSIDKNMASYEQNQLQLKEKILDAAIKGKLVEQRADEGTAEDLYNQIKQEKRNLYNSGLFKGRRKIKQTSLDDTVMFNIPPSWKWIKLGDIVEIFGRIGFRGYTKNDIVAKGQGALSMSPSNFSIDGKMDFHNSTYISWEKYNESPEIMAQVGDILLVKTGSSYGKSALIKDLPEKSTINPQLVLLKYILCNKDYLNYVLMSTFAKKQFKSFVVGTAIPTFSQEKLYNMCIPLPPLEEQKRIVNKIERLLPLCDSLIK